MKKKKTDANYEGMSLRREHVENERLPRINIFHSKGFEEKAGQISFGIEEEGLPFIILESDVPFEDAMDEIVKKGLGVAIGLDSESAKIFSRQLKAAEAFMEYNQFDDDIMRIVGKNASKILKNRPFILEDDE